MSFPTTELLDSFIRPAEDPLSLEGAWKLFDSALTGAIEGEAFHSLHGTENTAVYYWSPGEFTEPAVKGEIYKMPHPGTGEELELWACLTKVTAPESPSGYRLQLHYVAFNKTGFIVERMDNGVLHLLGESNISEASEGDQVGFQVLAGKVISWYKHGAGAWEVVREDTDSTYTKGYVAVGVIGREPAWRNFGASGEASKERKTGHPPITVPIVGSRVLVAEHAAPTEHCAFPGAAHVLPSGEVLAVYCVKSKHESKDGVIYAKRSSNEGATWGVPYVIAKSLRAETGCANADATVLSDGSVVVLFDESDNETYQVIRCVRSTDEGNTFGSFATIPTNFTYKVTEGNNMGGAVGGPAVELSAPGHLVMGQQGCNAGQSTTYLWAATATSSNYGVTWATGVPITEYDGIHSSEEPCISWVKEPEGHKKLLVALRNDVDHDCRMASSTDEGATWSEPHVVEMASRNNVGRPALFQGKDGGLLLMQRIWETNGWPAFHYSSDFGATWSPKVAIDEENLPHVYGQWCVLPDSEEKACAGLVYAMQNSESVAKVYFRKFTASETYTPEREPLTVTKPGVTSPHEKLGVTSPEQRRRGEA
jgi:hypothetical protein